MNDQVFGQGANTIYQSKRHLIAPVWADDPGGVRQTLITALAVDVQYFWQALVQTPHISPATLWRKSRRVLRVAPFAPGLDSRLRDEICSLH